MGGSSIPYADLVPAVDPGHAFSMKDILVISNGGLECYGFHAMEVLQSIAEHRKGGESGVRSVQLIGGDQGEVWEAMDRGEWPEDLLLHAIAVYPDLPQVHPRTSEPAPAMYIVQYADGMKAYIIQFKRLHEHWAFAFHYDEGRIAASRYDNDLDRPFSHFERLTRTIETFLITRQPPFPPERTLLTSGMISFAMDSLYEGAKLDTPELMIKYESNPVVEG